jgi:hypothetical protein
VVPLAGGIPRHLTDDPGDSEPQFSHDGAQVIFRRGGPDGSRIFAVPAGGGTARPLSGDGVEGIAVSRAGDAIALQRSSGGRTSLHVVDLAGHERLVRGDLELAFDGMQVSPDGRRLLLHKKDRGVYEAPIDGSAPPVLLWKLEGAEAVIVADYAPDGDGLIGSLAMWDGDLWLAEGRFP